MPPLRAVIIALGLMVALSACAVVRFSLNYTPTSTEEIDSQIFVNDFTYFPKEGIAQDEIRETAAGRIFLTEPVGRFFSDAVRREFRQSGISLKNVANCYLDGEVTEFTIDSLGFSSDYVTDVRYIVKLKENDKTIFDGSYQVSFNTTKFVVASIVLGNINKAISDNIKQLLIDLKFVEVVESQCEIVS